jgi:ATP/maltotriose-dependent transcriptional regulator MalT
MPNTTRSLGEIADYIAKANQFLKERREAEDEERRATTAALNAVLALQREMDERIAELRKNAPRDTDWARDKYRSTGPSIG